MNKILEDILLSVIQVIRKTVAICAQLRLVQGGVFVSISKRSIRSRLWQRPEGVGVVQGEGEGEELELGREVRGIRAMFVICVQILSSGRAI